MGIILFIAYAALLLSVSFFDRHNTVTQEAFFLNKRKSSSTAVGVSTFTSCVGASATIGVIGLSFQVGIPAIWWLGSCALGLIVLGYVFAGRVRASKAYTLSEIIAKQLGNKAEQMASVIIVFAWTAIVSAQLIASIFLIQAMLGIEKIPALLLACLLITLHTIAGGQRGIIQLDKFQIFLIIGGILTLFIWGILYSPTNFHVINFSLINDQFPVSKVFYFCFALGGSYIVCPMLYGRVLSAKNESTAKRGILFAAILLFIFACMIVVIGLYARGVIPQNTSSDKVLITLLSFALNPWLTQFIYLFLLCAVVSSADACLFAASSALSRHLLRKQSIYANRYCSLLLMGVAVVLTFTNQTILEYLLMANNVYVCSIVIPVMLCFLLKKTASDIYQPLVLLGMVAAGLLGIAATLFEQNYIFYTGLLCSLIFTGLSFIKQRQSQITTQWDNL